MRSTSWFSRSLQLARRHWSSTKSVSTAMEISIESIRQLRSRSGAPISEVKAALSACEGDVESAMEELRKRGIAAAGKKSGRNAAEGIVSLHVDGSGQVAALVEINTETDFAARTEVMQDLARRTARAVCEAREGDVDVVSFLSAGSHPERIELRDAFAEASASIRENFRWRRAHTLRARPPASVFGRYVHNQLGMDVGTKAALVLLEIEGGDPRSAESSVKEMAEQLAMHVVALRPKYLDVADVPECVLETEKEILRAQMQDSGKPASVVDKIVTGRLRKFFEEHCLMQQPFVVNDKLSVGAYMAKESTSLGLTARVASFVRYECGEGLQKSESNFAMEVAEASR